MNDNLNKEVITLPPFKRLCMTIGELPSSYVETMTYYESLLWFCNYLGKTVIPTINNNAEAVEELQTKYIELKDYVDNYFENLDIQEEINNKLDEMAESGELADIIAQYLQVNSVLGFDTKASLKSAENLVNGSITRTLGTDTYNDGKGNYYKIRTLTSGDIIDDDNILALANYPTLIAEKLPDYEINQLKLKVNNIYDTLDELIADESTYIGKKVITLGSKEINDGLGGYYIIRNTGEIELNNGLYASLINNINENYYNVTYTSNRYNNTDYYLTYVPFKDEENNIIKLEVEKDNVNAPLEHAHKEYTSFTCNANVGFYDTDADDSFHDTLVIGNGEILNPAYPYVTPLPNYYKYLCFDNERNYTSYQANLTSAETILNAGYTQAFMVYFPIITNGIADLPTGSILNDKSQKQIIGIKEDKSLIIMTTDGRSERNEGLTYSDCVDILLANGCYNAWATDGGGSTSTIVKGSKINRNYDDNFTTDRLRPYTLNAKRTIRNKNIANSYNMRGTQLQLLNKQILDHVKAKFQTSLIFCNFTGYTLTTTGNAEKIPLSITTNVNSPITYDSTNRQFILPKGKYKVYGNFYIASRTAQNKYLAAHWNGTEQTLISLTCSNNAQRVQFNMFYVVSSNVDDNTLDFRLNGTISDSVERGTLIIERINE